MPQRFAIGERIVFIKPLVLTHDGFIQAGETGFIAEREEGIWNDGLWVTLDAYHRALSYYNNDLWVCEEDLDLLAPAQEAPMPDSVPLVPDDLPAVDVPLERVFLTRKPRREFWLWATCLVGALLIGAVAALALTIIN